MEQVYLAGHHVGHRVGVTRYGLPRYHLYGQTEAGRYLFVYVDREAIRQQIAEEAAHWDVTDTSAQMEQETEWSTFAWTEREDRCERCGARMEARQIDLHLAGGRTTLHDVTWYVCRTPGCGNTRLSPALERLVRRIEADVREICVPASSPTEDPVSEGALSEAAA
ncbi:MAG: hypothetical protein SVX38_08190 [Chloroflexota bacterium]|nr:hypothetical protein [Chloroflexota bacterium]